MPGRREAESCPTCGQSVTVQSTDEGTSYFVPVAEARAAGASAGQAVYKAEVERLRARVAELEAERDERAAWEQSDDGE